MNEFIAFLDNLLGVYTPVLDSAGNIPPGFAGVDFSFVFRAIIFCIVVHSVFRIFGGIICKTY